MKKYIICLLVIGSWFAAHASHEKVDASGMPRAVQRSMYSSLFAFVDRGELSSVQAYFSLLPCDVDHCDEDGASLLMHAIRNHRIRVMIYLIYRKANIFCEDNHGMCPLTQAELEDNNHERGSVPLLPLLVRGWLLKNFPVLFEPQDQNHGSIRNLHNSCQQGFYLNLMKQS